ncbi:MAG: hypothetical protein HEP71_18425 [Roseivirga sp.]|nr:hypothetical protein [Roseivirga sp.]
MPDIKVINKLGAPIDVVTDGVTSKVETSATLSVNPSTLLNFKTVQYLRIVGEFIPDGGYTIKQGEEADRIVFQSAIGETVVAFQTNED